MGSTWGRRTFHTAWGIEWKGRDCPAKEGERGSV